jgi:hypothetical protein
MSKVIATATFAPFGQGTGRWIIGTRRAGLMILDRKRLAGRMQARMLGYRRSWALARAVSTFVKQFTRRRTVNAVSSRALHDSQEMQARNRRKDEVLALRNCVANDIDVFRCIGMGFLDATRSLRALLRR